MEPAGAVAEVADERPGPGQAGDRPDGAGEEGDLDRGHVPQHRLLGDHPTGVGDGGQQAQHDAHDVGSGAPGGRADQEHPGERDTEPDEQPAREALAQQEAGEQRDQQRPDVDQHRRGAGVQVPFGGVERHVVDAEPADPAADEQRPLPAGRAHPVTAREQQAQHDGADQQPAERQGPGREVGAHRTDRDEGRGPREHRDDDSRDGATVELRGRSQGNREPESHTDPRWPYRQFSGGFRTARSGGQGRRCSA